MRWWQGLAACLLLLGSSCSGWQDATVEDAVLEADGVTLTLAVSACHADVLVDVDEGATQVGVEASAKDPQRGEDCFTVTPVRLQAPLGEREVVDTRYDRVVPVRQRG